MSTRRGGVTRWMRRVLSPSTTFICSIRQAFSGLGCLALYVLPRTQTGEALFVRSFLFYFIFSREPEKLIIEGHALSLGKLCSREYDVRLVQLSVHVVWRIEMGMADVRTTSLSRCSMSIRIVQETLLFGVSRRRWKPPGRQADRQSMRQ